MDDPIATAPGSDTTDARGDSRSQMLLGASTVTWNRERRLSVPQSSRRRVKSIVRLLCLEEGK
jgi:hypothetical protein